MPNTSKSEFGFTEFLNGIDALVSFGLWPYDKPVFVLSNSLDRVPEGYEDKAEIVKGDLKTVLGKLEERGMKNLYVDGGRVISSFLKEDLIDEMIISRVSILLGGGIPLFDELGKKLKFKLINADSYGETLVQCHYVRVRG